MRIFETTALFFRRQILPEIQSKWRKRLAFGFEALSIRPIDSLKANARLVGGEGKRKTAETRMYRVSHTERLVGWFPTLIGTLRLVRPGDAVNADFSDFHGRRQVLMFSKQTGKGRAIPLFFAFLTYPIENPGSQNRFIMETVGRFLAHVGHRDVTLVFDRGFMIPSLVRFLAALPVPFLIRVRAGKQVMHDGKRRALRGLPTRDEGSVSVYGQPLRVVRSRRKKGAKEPWILLTNDFGSAADGLVSMYYRRFEIEEFFKDAKRLSGTEFFLHMKDAAFSVTLWFLVLGYWIAWLCAAVRHAWEFFAENAEVLHEKRCLVRYLFELLRQEQYRLCRRTLKFKMWEV